LVHYYSIFHEYLEYEELMGILGTIQALKPHILAFLKARKKGARSAEQKQRFWREMIKAQASGNLAVKPFCKQQNISDAAFYQ